MLLPATAPGCGGAADVIVNVRDRAALCPQPLFVFTVNCPPVEPAVTVIEFVDEVPVQPEGKVHK